MVEKKSILQTIQDFTQKLEEFSQHNGVRIPQENSETQKLTRLQQHINQQDEEKRALLRSQFQEFAMPVTQDIEKDEEDLLKAYELFCQLKSLNEQSGDRQTHLKSLALSSPLCHKSEYAAEGSTRFALLRLWFLTTKPDAQFVPEITEDSNGSVALEFTDLDLWQPSSFEKEIMQAFDD